MDGQRHAPLPPRPVSQLAAHHLDASLFEPSTAPATYGPSQHPPHLQAMTTLSMDGLGSFSSDLDDPRPTQPAAPSQQQKQRRRQSSNSDVRKHRRTRSGCYTCRQRRVKCDETHPICERCRKGKRECTYPSNASSSSASASASASSRSGRNDVHAKGSTPDSLSSPSACSDDYDTKAETLSAILDDEEGEAREEGRFRVPSTSKSQPQETGAAVSAGRMTPGRPAVSSLQHASSYHSKQSPVLDNVSSSDKWQRLPKEMEAYLRYHRERLSHHHYAFKQDRGDFLKTTFLEIALNDDSSALLFAIVAFAAYHHAVHRARDSWQTFLTYYNKAIEALKESLLRKRHNSATLFTILQLATIEEFLGDWLNLHYHLRAAHQILTEMYRVGTIMQDETRRKIVTWFFRFDIFAGMMSGSEPCLSREWYAASAHFYRDQALHNPGDLGAQFEDFFATSRLLATDVALLFAARKKHRTSDERFLTDAHKLLEDLNAFGRRLENSFSDSPSFAAYLPNAASRRTSDKLDGRHAGLLYGGELFTMNFVLLDFWTITLLFKHQLEMTQGRPNSPELMEIVHKKCKMFEAIQHSGQSPNGALLGCQASLGVMCLFLSTDKRHIEWCRRKFALIESEGYLYPVGLHQKMTRLWGEDVTHWWLPNGEGCSGTIQVIKDFVDFRRGVPRDSSGVDLCDMNGLFQSLNVIETRSTAEEHRTARVDSAYGPYVPTTNWRIHPEPVTTSG